MLEPIIPGEVLIQHDLNASVCSSETAEKAPRIERKWRKRSAITLAGYSLFVAADNAAYYYDTMKVSADDGSMIEDFDGCDPFPSIENNGGTSDGGASMIRISPEDARATKAVEDKMADVRSAADNFEPEKLNVFKFTLDWLGIHQHEILSFESSYSGLDVHLYTDQADNPFTFESQEETTATIDELMHSTLSANIDYGHIGVAAFADCLRYRFIDPEGPRELEDERLNIYVPSRPGVCFSNGLVQDFPTGADSKDFCDSIGGTYKDVRIAIRPFYEYKRDWMVLMSRNKSPEKVNSRLSKHFIHEPTHLFMQYAGLPFKYHPNERLADYLEDEALKQLYDGNLPKSLSYPTEAFAAFPSENVVDEELSSSP